MKKSTPVLLLAVLISQTQCAPQFLTFKDGKIGVNFGGYHAGVGFGGLLGGNTAGGLYAEAGTPHGQSAVAGLGGAVGGENGGSSGGLFAGATAGNGINAQTGLAGNTGAGGAGYASAQAGNNYAATGMVEGSSGFSSAQPTNKKIHTEINIDSANEVQPAIEVDKRVSYETIQPVVVKEVSKIWRPSIEVLNPGKPNFQAFFNYLFNTAFAAGNQRPWYKPQHGYIFSQVYVSPKTQVVEKEIIHTHYKPRKNHFRKTAFLGGYVGGQGDIVGPPQIQKRIDVDVDSSANAGVAAGGSFGGGDGTTYTKEVTVQNNPSFFDDIFNIPISTLRAVSSFLGNTASNTHVSVQKSAQVHADSDSVLSKHEPSLSSSPTSSSSSAHISVETPSASKFIDDILAIPINTLSAVNKFLVNNAARKSVQVSDDGTVQHSRVRLGPARRRANKHVVVVKEETPIESVTE